MRNRSWNIPMPRAPREDGQAHIRAAVKFADGSRIEYDGALPKFLARATFYNIIRGPVPEGQDEGIAAAFASAA